MRTTLTLDDDIARLLNQEMRHSGASFKDAVNHFPRLGLAAAKQPAPRLFKVNPRPLGLPAVLTYDDLEQVIEALESERHLRLFWDANILLCAYDSARRIARKRALPGLRWFNPLASGRVRIRRYLPHAGNSRKRGSYGPPQTVVLSYGFLGYFVLSQDPNFA